MACARIAFTVLILGVAALASPSPAEACSCIGPGPSSTAVQQADLVFTGVVTRIDGPKPRSVVNADGSVSLGWTSEPPVTAIDVTRVFKGAPPRQVAVNGDGCHIAFKTGEAWLVYASILDGRVVTGSCRRTRPSGQAAQDFAFLEGLEQGRRQGIVYGDVHRRIAGRDGSPALQALFGPLQVTAAGDGRRFTVTTDRWGPYQLVLPPGEFEIWVERAGRPVSARQSVRVEHGDDRRVMLVAEFTESAGAQEPARDTSAGALDGAAAQSPQRTLQPTPLEAFVTQPGTRTAWSRFIRRLDGGSASAIVTAIASTTEATPPRVMRGVRIELRHEGVRPDCDLTHLEWAIMCARENAAIYIEEERLASIRAALEGGSAEVRPGYPAGITRFGGGAGSGTLIVGYLLYNVTLADVSAALAEAAALLKTAPRQPWP